MSNDFFQKLLNVYLIHSLSIYLNYDEKKKEYKLHNDQNYHRINFGYYFFLSDTLEVLRLLFRKGSFDFVVVEVLLMLLLFLLAMVVFLPRLLSSTVFVVFRGDVDDDDIEEVDAVLVGIRLVAVAACRPFIFVVTLRLVLSLSCLRLMGMGDDRSDTLRRFGNGVTLGDNDTLLFGDFATVGVNFFNCSTRCVGLLICSKDLRFRVMMFFSLNSATSAFRVRCTITFSLFSTFNRSNLTWACDSR